MSLLNKVKKNKVSLDLENYCILLRGQEKSGKTTFYADLINTFYKDPEKGLLIPFEKGYSAIDSINVFPYTILPEMSIDGVTKRGWDVFQELVKELIETKDQHGIRMVCIDTVDEFMRVATAKVIQMSIAETKKPCKSLNDAFNGYGRGRERLGMLIKDTIQKLRNAGFGLVFIGHTKYKTLKTKGDETEYQILGSNLSEDLDKMIANDADMILMITQEPTIVDGKMIGNERKLRLRSDGFYAAGSRLKHVPETIECSASAFIHTMQEAVKAAAHISSDAEYTKALEEEVAHKTVETTSSSDDEVKVRIVAAIKNKLSELSAEEKKEFANFVQENKINFKEPTSVNLELLQFIVDKYELIY